MKKETIDSLKKLKLGERLSSYKPLSEEEKELQNTLSKLKNFGILSLNKNSYSVLNFKLLSKFIELQNFEKLAEYIENPNELENGIKSSLEYKILKHLEENDNGEYIDMSEFNSDLKLLTYKLSSLAKKPEKYISIDLGTSFRFENGSKFERDCILAKIEFNGIKYLNEIDNQSLVFSINQETNKNNTNKYKPWYIKLPMNLWKLISENKLISFLVGLIILYLLKKYCGIDLKNP
jgi:hypothetical protein